MSGFTFMQLSNIIIFFLSFHFLLFIWRRHFFSFCLSFEKESVLGYLLFKGVVTPDSETVQI